eukprot:6205684-Pleurochrysis_carterae.AAC.1
MGGGWSGCDPPREARGRGERRSVAAVAARPSSCRKHGRETGEERGQRISQVLCAYARARACVPAGAGRQARRGAEGGKRTTDPPSAAQLKRGVVLLECARVATRRTGVPRP